MAAIKKGYFNNPIRVLYTLISGTILCAIFWYLLFTKNDWGVEDFILYPVSIFILSFGNYRLYKDYKP